MNRLKNLVNLLGGFKYYILAVLVFFGVFSYSEYRGHRLLGDDRDEQETHSTGGSGRSHFYHK